MESRSKKEMLEYSRGLRTMLDVIIESQKKSYYLEELCHKLAVWNDKILVPWWDAMANEDDELATARDIPLPRL